MGGILTICKICDVRDLATATLCAEAGASLLGLHARHLADESKTAALVEISNFLPAKWPSVGIVLVTQSLSVSTIKKEVATLRPHYVQLHAAGWTAAEVLSLRDALRSRAAEEPRIIGFAQVPLKSDRELEVAIMCDAVIVDSTDYVTPRPDTPVAPAAYAAAVVALGSKPALIAGGFSAGNVGAYVEAAMPWGVDVQRGVEVPGPGGRKDPENVRAFVDAVKLAGQRNRLS